MLSTVIDLRSDAVTLPTQRMYEAMREAPLGTDRFGEDPTVRKLEEMAAQVTGKEAALFVPSGTMGNLIALLVHAHPGEAAIVEWYSHIFRHELGGMSSLAGLMPIPIRGKGGLFDAQELREVLQLRGLGLPHVTVLCLENTHNLAGGVAIHPTSIEDICQVARTHRLSIHLDGARIFNAAIALGMDVRDLAANCDSVMFCLSKGLSTPLGAVLAGSNGFIKRARRARRRLGGEMYQAGVVAAAGIVALERMVDRLVDDHRTARRLGEGIANISPLRVDLETVQTNIVVFDVGELGLKAEEFAQRLSTKGVLTSAVTTSGVRMVTHRHISDEDMLTALEAVKGLVATFTKTDR